MGHEHDPLSHEKLKMFDMMASVNIMRFDVVMFGAVLPETKQRVHDEELSLLAEGADRVLRRPDTFPRDDDGRLTYFDKGQPRPYMGMLQTGLGVAKAEAARDYRKQFLVDWAERDYEIGMRMEALTPGAKTSWVSRYPYKVEAMFGQKFLREECGLFPERKMAFIYHAVCNKDGSVTLETQSIDNSDDEAFDAVEQAIQYDPEHDLDTLRRINDGFMTKKFGARFYAGRRGASAKDNAWEELLKHQDLITYYLDKLEAIARQDHPSERETKELMIGVWKLFKKRLSGETESSTSQPTGSTTRHAFMIDERAILNMQVRQSYREARNAGEVKVGCGGSLSAGEDESLADIDSRATFDSIFGKDKKNTGETKYSFDKEMFCVVCQAPPKKEEKKKMCGPCGICRGCDVKIRAKAKGGLVLST